MVSPYLHRNRGKTRKYGYRPHVHRLDGDTDCKKLRTAVLRTRKYNGTPSTGVLGCTGGHDAKAL